jgi:transposase
VGPASCSDPSHAHLLDEVSALRTQLAESRRDAAALRTDLQALGARIAELEARSKRNSRNSSRPPSSDSPYQDRPSRGKPSGREPGGQPGHEGKTRPTVPPEDVSEFVVHGVDDCPACGGSDLEQTATVAHQVTEIPPVAPIVVEHQVAHVRCRDCGEESVGTLPADVARSQFGPRVHAFAAQLSGGFRLTHREVGRVFEEMFGLHIGGGTLTAMQRRVTDALEFPYREAQRALREGPAAYIDETGWRVGRRKATLWTAFFGRLVVFLVDSLRDRGASRRLFAGKFHGVRIVDRYVVHDHVKDELRQICAAHVWRDFEGFATGAAGGRMFGRRGKAIVLRLFRAWWRFRDGKIDRAGLRAACAKLERRLCELLDEAMTGKHARVRGFAKKLRKQAACLFTFAKVEGIEPTNNWAERMLRAAVLWRKGSFGSHSKQGARFVSRFMTAARSLRMQGRDVIDFVMQALEAHALGRAPPSLVPALVGSAE